MRNKSLSKLGIRKKRNLQVWKEPEVKQGIILGNYRFLELIGVGEFGEVYRAESLEVTREVAIKLYKIHDNEALRAFKRGANLLAQIDHPHIVRLLDFFTIDRYALMVMEMLSPDQTLRELAGSFCSQEAINDFIKILSDMLSAMRYCHHSKFRDFNNEVKVGIYHGDIKPDNIFVHKGQIKIADFMIPNLEQLMWKYGHQESFPYYDTRFYGTPMYMCPEQSNGIVNEQTDIYNIGVTSFELLTGFYPYDSEEEYRDDLCSSPAKYCPHSPDWLNKVLLKCLVHDESLRYAHISEIEREIIQFVQEDKKMVDGSKRVIYTDKYFEKIDGGYHEHNYAQKQDLAEAAAEIQKLLDRLAQTYPNSTESTLVQVIQAEIKRNPTLKSRLTNALKSGGIEALKAAFNHPFVSVPIETIKGFLEAEAE